MSQITFEISNLCKKYPRSEEWAVKNVDLQIKQGEIFGLLGENGAGKSTLVKQIVGLLKPTGGTIKFNGRNIAELNPAETAIEIGYMPQKATSLNQMTVWEALYFTAHLRGLTRAEAKQETNRLIEMWGLEGLKSKNNRNLSGGQMRMLRLAVAMAGRPPILILDEPTNDLDPMRRNLVWDILRKINREEETTIVFITHDAVEAEKIIERVGIMRAGSLVAVGRPRDLKKVVDQSLRLDLFFDPSLPPQIPQHARQVIKQDGHWRFIVEWDAIPSLMPQLNLAEIEDFRLYSATLEDLYLYYTGDEHETTR